MEWVMPWEREFGAEYAVPEEILRHVRTGALRDLSWHNDACPSFGVPRADGTERARVWVEHPVPNDREDPRDPRFIVCIYDEGGDALGAIYLGDDVDLALGALGQAIYGNGWDGEI